jgi:indolepyruvate ferredoxin oxidoreductase, beta subunit
MRKTMKKKLQKNPVALKKQPGERIFNVLMAGVGGQGIVLASDILSLAAMNAGYDVKKSEIHGMSQRGGSVFSFVRFGSSISSPVISKGSADILVSLEEMETLRWLAYASPSTKVFLCRTRILPAEVQMQEYPSGIEDALSKSFKSMAFIETNEIIKTLGNQKYLNVYIMGLVAQELPLSEKNWVEAIRSSVPEKHFEKNLQAFHAGMKKEKEKEKENRHDLE